ncbi:MAG: hypothetical protein KBC17_00415 [Candidatus Pacebacteria bacterium]|nr:hypothetical protein [Candidatus Paceibacterota bacterium]
MQNETRNCQNCKNDFTIEPEDFDFYQKVNVPPPTFCADCRFQRRLAFRNERNFYKRDCDLCGTSVVSRVSPDKTFPMYCSKCWWSDKWDPCSYGKEYDFLRPFFEQWLELFLAVPQISILNSNAINSEWINQENDSKNCYMNVGGMYNEDCAYCTYGVQCKNCFDNYWIFNSDHSSNNVHCERDYFTHFSYECHDSLNTVLSYDCRNCSNVIGCAGLRNKQYCIFNEQYTKEEYQKFLSEHPISSHRGLSWWKEQIVPIWNNSPHRENTIFKSVDTTGNAVSEAKNSHNVWECTKIENSKNLFITGWARDLYDCSCLGAAELAYECAHSGGVYDSKFLLFCISNDPLKKVTINTVEYSTMVGSVSNCFGCVCVRGAEYTILNKKYTKEEYNELLPRIKKHMQDMPYVDKMGRVYKYGEFFPTEFSSYGYNETTAPDIFPLSKEEALAQGYKWSDYVSDTHYEFSDYTIPDDIKDVGDDILKMILKCEVSGKAYRIVPAELSFYRQAGLPIPRVAGAERHKERYKMLLPTKLFDRTCDNCKKDIRTPYEKGRPEVVYCESCYQKEVL